MKRKGVPRVFWYGIALLYSYTFILMTLEMSSKNLMSYNVKIGGAPLSFLYNGFIAIFALNVFLAWLWYYVPEQEDKKIAAAKGVKKDGN
jgi:hypothetical protein